MTKKKLIGLKSDDFRHPLDLQSTNALKQIPGLDLLVRSLLGSVAEQFLYLNNIASNVLVGENQLPHLHQLLVEACQILDLEPPQLYLQQNPAPNAYTFAMKGQKPFMVIHTSLIEMLTPQEIQAVMAHELGHLKCEHGVYLTLVNILVLATGLIPYWGALIAQSIQSLMLEWLRCAELSCDRAALLVVQDPRIVMSVLMKLAGGSPSIAPLLNLDAFIAQAKEYTKMNESEVEEMFRNTQNKQLTHPLPVLRAREIDLWASSSQYTDLLQKGQIEYNGKDGVKGGWRNW